MSPLLLRRFRAERLLREEFDALRSRVLSSVRTRLSAGGTALATADLEACYSLAWQGLYAAVLDGQEIGNPAGWLAVAAFRRAIEECRVQGRRRHGRTAPDPGGELDPSRRGELDARRRREGLADAERDLAAELEDRVRLRQLFEGLRVRLSERELQAATLCYLQGLTRAEAAHSMGISAERMRKLMEGQGPRRPGVAAKVGALAEAIAGGGWCEEQGSLMRGLAFGVLDPAGERSRIAQLHRSECPACRAYVLSLRGLASVLPPLPSLLHAALGAAGVGAAGAGGVAGASLAGAPSSGTAGGSAAGAASQSGPAIAGTVSASGVAGAGGAAGGGWLLAGGPLGAKLAAGCLLALSLGAGCVALSGGVASDHRPNPRAHARTPGRGEAAVAAAASSGRLAAGGGTSVSRLSSTTSALTPASRASREFGPEQGLQGGETHTDTSSSGTPVSATASSSAFEQRQSADHTPARSTPSGGGGEGSGTPANAAAAGGSTHAEREFGIG